MARTTQRIAVRGQVRRQGRHAPRRYAGLRIATDCAIATATVKFRMDVSFGDPITPQPGLVEFPSLRPGLEPVHVPGYPVETVLAEKLATAIALGPANTRVRDYADIYTLTGSQVVDHRTAREAVLATAAYRGTAIEPLSEVIGILADLRRPTFEAYRTSLGPAGLHLPADFREVVSNVTAFADLLVANVGDAVWRPAERRWSAS